jgi:transcriptional regulator with XRE-family HTH domain
MAPQGAICSLGAAMRKARGISQEELAHRSHINRSYMSNIERGAQHPGVMTVVQIAAGMGVSVVAVQHNLNLPVSFALIFEFPHGCGVLTSRSARRRTAGSGPRVAVGRLGLDCQKQKLNVSAAGGAGAACSPPI